jgi:hypothetical protein
LKLVTNVCKNSECVPQSSDLDGWRDSVGNSDGTTAEAVRLEAAKTKETADRMANGESTDEKDDARVLAGMIKQIAEQVERLAALMEESR